jgi:predicted Zn-ribbon and HTH transcriptional regulator
MGEITLKGYQCERCNHKWIPREESEIPRVCPKCKSPYWDKPRKIEGKKKDIDLKEKRRLR